MLSTYCQYSSAVSASHIPRLFLPFVGTISSINESFQVSVYLRVAIFILCYFVGICYFFTLLSRLDWKYSHRSLTGVPRLFMFRIGVDGVYVTYHIFLFCFAV